MTIRPHYLDEGYDDAVYEFLKREERFISHIYSDSEGVPTLGVGYALAVKNEDEQLVLRGNLEPDLLAIGIILTNDDRQRINNAVDAFNGVPGKQNTIPGPNGANVFSFSIDEPNARTLLERVLPEYEDVVRNRIGATLFNQLAESSEMVALVSLAYNAHALIGDDLVAALQAGDRAEAWFEIRYQSNGNRIHGNRRYREAETFSLYDEDGPIEEDAKGAFRMYTRHKIDSSVQGGGISGYEGTYSRPSGIPNITGELSAARSFLIDTYVIGQEIDIDITGDILVGEDQSTLYFKGSDADAPTPTWSGGAMNDLIFGESGNDEIRGGKGDDVLYGGSDSDTLKGGAGGDYLIGGTGNDRYQLSLMDAPGADGETILDEDRNGSVFLDQEQLTGGERQGDTDTYRGKDSQGRVYFYRWAGDGQDLFITGPANMGPVVVERFNNHTLGIDLEGPEPETAAFAAVGAMHNPYESARDWRQPRRRDPLTLDLDGDGIETVGIQGNATVLFDHDADGIRTGSGWVKGDDGLVVLDRNSNGTIDSGHELFGADTVLSNGQTATSGFAALADLDANADGVFDANDTQFANVRLWRDANQDGISQASELSSLTDSGIAAINLSSTATNINLGNGNTQVAAGTYVRTNATTGTAGNLDLVEEPYYRLFADAVEWTEATRALPGIYGSGWVRDLRDAATLSEDVAAALSAYAQEDTRAGRKAQLAELVHTWAESSGAATSIEQADGHGYLLIYLTPGESAASYDALLPYWNSTPEQQAALTPQQQQQLAALKAQQASIGNLLGTLERFNAETFVAVSSGGVTTGTGQWIAKGTASGVQRAYVSLSSTQMGFLSQSFAGLTDAVFNGLEPQILNTQLTPYLAAVDWTGGTPDFAAMNQALETLKTTDPERALAHVIELSQYANGTLRAFGWSVNSLLTAWAADIAASSELQAVLTGYNAKLVSGSFTGDGTAQYLVALDSGAIINAGAGNDQLVGGAAADNLQGEAGNDAIDGGAGNDLAGGGDGNDTLQGAQGNDTLYGHAGGDVYEFRLGDGQDVIEEAASATSDVLRFGAGIDPADIVLTRSGNDLLVRHLNGTDQITVRRWYEHGNYRFESVEFADGTQWSGAEVTTRGLVVNGTTASEVIDGLNAYADNISALEGDDTVRGYGGNDTLNGGPGNDQLVGGLGNDTFVVQLGDGADTISNSSGDVLKFTDGVAVEDLVVTRSGIDLVLHYGSGADQVTVQGWFGAYSWYRLDRAEFADGTVLLEPELTALGLVVNGTPGDDLLEGLEEYHDTLNGLDGNDTLDGKNGNDILCGGPGADLLVGREGDDTYVFAIGDGDGTIVDTTGANLVRFSTGIAPSDVNVERVGHDLILHYGASDRVIVPDWYEIADNQLDGAVFADGSTWSKAQIEAPGLTLTGTDDDDVLLGGNAADERLIGLAGNDQLDGRAGADSLEGGAGIDQLYGGDGADLLDGGADADVLEGALGADTLRGGEGNDVLTGDGPGSALLFNPLEDGDDLLEGGAGDDVLDSGSGYNTLRGGEGNDNARGGILEDILEGEAGNDVMLGWDGADSMYGGTGYDVLVGNSGQDYVEGGDDDDVLAGDNALNLGLPIEVYLPFLVPGTADTLKGGLGNDRLYGEEGDDLLDGEDGNDVLNGGIGADRIYGQEGNDVADGGADNDLIEGDVGLDSLEGGGGDDAIYGQDDADVLSGGAGIDQIYGGLGADVLKGGAGADQLYGEDDGDVMHGDEGEDLLVGGVGNDALLGGADRDTLQGQAGIDVLYGQVGDDVLDGGVETDVLLGGAGLDALTGGDGDDLLDGGAGQDLLIGGAGNDVLGGAEDLAHDGINSANTYIGGTGNDTLIGSEDGDSYLHDLGDGADQIIENGDAALLDILRFGTGISQTDLTVAMNGADLVLSHQNGLDRVTVKGWMLSSRNQLERVEFADGSAWSAAQLNSQVNLLVQALGSTGANDGQATWDQAVQQLPEDAQAMLTANLPQSA